MLQSIATPHNIMSFNGLLLPLFIIYDMYAVSVIATSWLLGVDFILYAAARTSMTRRINHSYFSKTAHYNCIFIL